jgi:hypothetical protein
MRLALALFLGLSLYAVPAKADTISLFGRADFVDFAFSPTTGVPIGGPTVEYVTTAFLYDTTSQQISDMNFNSNGPLGPFTFSGVTNDQEFEWTSSLAEIFLNVPIMPTSVHPLTGAGTKNLGIVCLTQACNDDFGGLYNFNDALSFTSFTWLSGSPSDPPSPTPEPSSLILLGIGLVGAVFMSRRLVTS